MIDGKKVLAIIPARGGSKGIPRKNIKILAGKPLIAWTIEEAKKSKYIDRLILSSDDEEIIKVAKEWGCEVPFVRPKELAEDNSSSIDVIINALNNLKNFSDDDIVLLLEPTSPLRTSSDIDDALLLLVSNLDAESIVGLAEVESQHPNFLVKLDKNYLKPYLNKDFHIFRRQEIDKLYFFEGSIYASKIKALKEKKNFYHEKCIGYVVQKWKSFEIDNPEDFIIIESLLIAKNEGKLK